MSFLLILFWKIEKNTPKQFVKPALPNLIPKPKKDTTKIEKQQLYSNVHNEYRCKNTQQRIANQIQQHIKIIIHHDWMGLFPGMQRWFDIGKWINVIHHITEEWMNVIHHIRYRKCFWQNSTSIFDKTLNKMGIEGTYPNIINTIYDKPTDNCTLSGESLKVFLLWSGIKQGCTLSPLLSNIVLEVQLQQLGRKVLKALGSEDMIWYIKISKDATKKNY